MIDINNKHNFDQLPTLKSKKCDLLNVNGSTSNSNTVSKKVEHDFTSKYANDKSKSLEERLNRKKSCNNLLNSNCNSSQSNQKNTSKTTTVATTTTTNNKKPSQNPVRAANQNFFLIPDFKDQNFLKNECELARSQVIRATPSSVELIVEKTKIPLTGGKSIGSQRRDSRNAIAYRSVVRDLTNTLPSTNYARTNGDTNNNAHAHIPKNANSNSNTRSQIPTSMATSTIRSRRTSAVGTSGQMPRTHAGLGNGLGPRAGANELPLTNGHAVGVTHDNSMAHQKLPKTSQCCNQSCTTTTTTRNQRLSTVCKTYGTTVATLHSNKTTAKTLVGHGNSTQQRTSNPTTNGTSRIANASNSNNLSNIPTTSATKITANNRKVSFNNNSSNQSSSNSNNNNDMWLKSQTQNAADHYEKKEAEDEDDIKFIDSDNEQQLHVANATKENTTAAAAAAVATTSVASDTVKSGPILASTMTPHSAANCRNNSCRLRCGCATTPATATTAAKVKLRPKSTIISGSGSSSGSKAVPQLNSASAAAASLAALERRREIKSSIDPNAIKASIELFNSLSEQKKLPLVTLRAQSSNKRSAAAVGSNSNSSNNKYADTTGSASNLQHYRYSSDFSDAAYNLRQLNAVASSGSGGGGSLTRAISRNMSATTATTAAVNTKLPATAPSSGVSKLATATAAVTPLAVKARITAGCPPVVSAGSRSGSPGKSSPESSSSPAHASPTNNNSSRLMQQTLSKQAAAAAAGMSAHWLAAERGRKKDIGLTGTHSSSNNIDAHATKAPQTANSSNACDAPLRDESVRSTSNLRNALPPSSPTPSRYWDRDSRTAATTTASTSNSTTRNDDSEEAEGLCGLRNIGNTCFMNSIIQCLSHTTELTKFLRSPSVTRVSSSTKDQAILQEFAKLIREMWSPNVRSVTPSELKRSFSMKHRMYSDYNQQDAQEFLRFFLDSLHSALNTGVKGEHLKIDDNLSDNRKADLTWEWYTRHEDSLIRDLFVGQLKSTLTCTVCGNTSVTFDPFWDLSVPLPSSNRCRLDTCLDLFIREEVLDGDEMPKCSKCQTRRKCTKRFTIQRFPKYLVIHLKRFSETRWSKMSNVVDFPTGERELNMAPYGSNQSTSAYYSLYAISNHMGSTAGGHYVALCKHPVTKKWHEFNDNMVSSHYESSLVSSSAYILFYERA